MIQTLLDVIGKLGPLLVAIAVFQTGRAQTSWANSVQRRASEVEDQKLRLALLERRLIAIDAIRVAAQQFGKKLDATPGIIAQVEQGLETARIVFGPDEEAAIAAVIRDMHDWQGNWHQLERYRETDQTRYAEIGRHIDDVESSIQEQLRAIGASLRSAARISFIPQIDLPQAPSAWDRLRLSR